MEFGKPLGTHYGALLALLQITSHEGMKMLVLPNLKMYSDDVLKSKLADENTRRDAEQVLEVLVSALRGLGTTCPPSRANGVADLESLRERLTDKIGDVLTEQIIANKMSATAQVVLEANVSI